MREKELTKVLVEQVRARPAVGIDGYRSPRHHTHV